MFIPSNYTIEEIIKLYENQLPSELVKALNNWVDEGHRKIKEAYDQWNAIRYDYEIADEQIYFAKELLSGISEALDNSETLEQFKEKYGILRYESYFET